MILPKPTRGGFTIIELLVVITIITLLIALLLPSLATARDRANEVKCSGNIRMLYVGIAAYATDDHLWVPPAWYIMERQWTGPTWSRFAHNMMSSYISPNSKAWLDPAWSENVPYQTGLTTNGTPENPAAGSSPGTPHNFGEGYYYRAWMWTTFLADPNWQSWAQGQVRFDKPQNPGAAEILSCMMAQQAPTLGQVGPHRQGHIWNILWLDGTQTQSRGFFGPGPISFDLYVNQSGNWN